MLRGDFANIPAGTPHSWTLRSDRTKFTLFSTGDRVGAAYVAMGTPAQSTAMPTNATAITPSRIAAAAIAGDFLRVPTAATAGEVVRVTNLLLPSTLTPYVLLDGGGERFGGNTFAARNANTGGQFLFIVTEGGTGRGVGAHFHARHSEDFFALDGETLGWANGKAVSVQPGDLLHAPPRHLHGFKLTQPYNRFIGFLTPGIFEPFFTRGQPGRNGVGGRAAGEGAINPVRMGALGSTSTTQPTTPEERIAHYKRVAASAQGPDGYPLDSHYPTLPLPPQDPVWTSGPFLTGFNDTLFLEHAMMCAGNGSRSARMTPELQRLLALKPRAEEFV
jgi:quercetin dioxygenase-like cupin family protein